VAGERVGKPGAGFEFFQCSTICKARPSEDQNSRKLICVVNIENDATGTYKHLARSSSGWSITFLPRRFLKVSAEVLHSFQENLLLCPLVLGHQIDVALNLPPVVQGREFIFSFEFLLEHGSERRRLEV
jgi:hypothetical protein